jgi:hypothetical protein
LKLRIDRANAGVLSATILIWRLLRFALRVRPIRSGLFRHHERIARISKTEIGGEVGPVLGLCFDQRSGATPALAMVALFSFFYPRDGWTVFFHRYPDEIYIIFACTLVAALFFHRVTYTTYPKVFSITARTTAIGVSLYLAIEPPEFTLADAGKSNLLCSPTVVAAHNFGNGGADDNRPSSEFPAG